MPGIKGRLRLNDSRRAVTPAVSAWGMAVMTLLVLCAGTIVIRRAMRGRQRTT